MRRNQRVFSDFDASSRIIESPPNSIKLIFQRRTTDLKRRFLCASGVSIEIMAALFYPATDEKAPDLKPPDLNNSSKYISRREVIPCRWDFTLSCKTKWLLCRPSRRNFFWPARRYNQIFICFSPEIEKKLERGRRRHPKPSKSRYRASRIFRKERPLRIHCFFHDKKMKKNKK